MSDTLQRFVFEHAAVRGEIVQLEASWRAVLERHEYPEPVRELLGQLMAAAALLSATLKYDGILTMQVQGGGPVTLMVVECSSERTLRGLAHWRGEVDPGPLPELVGEGKLIITLDPGQDRERYQGIVSLQGDSLAAALDAYLAQSEQLATRLWLAADSERAAGLLIQRLPGHERDEDADTWNRVTHLSATVEPQELLHLGVEQILRRLYFEEDVRVFESEPVAFRCKCTRERVANMLRSLGEDEVLDILRTEGGVHVKCEFCNQGYDFDEVDVAQLFLPETSPDTPPTLH